MGDLDAKIEAAMAQEREEVLKDLFGVLEDAWLIQGEWARVMTEKATRQKKLAALRERNRDHPLAGEISANIVRLGNEADRSTVQLNATLARAHRLLDQFVGLEGTLDQVVVPESVKDVYARLLKKHRWSSGKAPVSLVSSSVNSMRGAMVKAGIEFNGNGH